MMTSFVNLPSMSQSLIGVLEVIIFLTTAAIIVTEVKHKHWKGLIYLIPIGISLYFASQCVFYIRSDIPIYGSTKAIVDTYGELPWPAIIGVLLIIAVLEIRVFRHNRKWIREHITATSIKEAIDNLPVGICVYEPNGLIVLKNYRMERICRAYTGKALLNATTFLDAIAAGSRQTEKGAIISLDNGEVFTFTDRTLKDEDSNLRMLSLVDITEQYKNTETLEEKRQLVAKYNEELVLYGKQIVDSITAREILEAKVKIHDELGVNLLASKRYILSGGSEQERSTIENALRRNLLYLKQEKESVAADEYEVILDTARKLDIKLDITGTLTDLEPQRHIIVTGIHECLTNTIRHAMGDELSIKLEENETKLMAQFINNGRAPEEEIHERGGLLLLRNLVEKQGGSMVIDSMPKFVLRLTLDK